LFFAAAITDNLLFACPFGADKQILRFGSVRRVLIFGLLVAVQMILGAILTWWVYSLFKSFLDTFEKQSIAALFCLAVVYAILRAGIHILKLAEKFSIDDGLPEAAALNGASLGAVLMAVLANEKLLHVLWYCMGSSAGLVAALLYVHVGRERMEFGAVPKAFHGLPVTLVYIGILSMAVYGLTGQIFQ
jgi:electron transport complex protein RnfA